MKKIYALMLAAACAVCLAGCVKDSLGNENVVPAPDAESFGSILSVTHEGCDIAGNDNPGTRTIVQNTKEVWWKYGDGIWVYDSEDDSQVYKYKAALSEGEMARTANFRIQNHEVPFTLGPGKYYAVYSSMTLADTKTSPPKLYASSDHTIHINLSAYQYHYEGALDYLPSYGIFGNGTSNVRMKPLCGGLRFRLSRGDIKQIVFKSNGGSICGDLTVSNLDSDSPVIENVNNGKGMIIELRTPSYSAFKADKDYFIVMTPGQMQGFIAELTTTDGSVIQVTSTKPQTIKAGVFGTLAQPLDTYGHVLPQYVDLGLSVPWATFNVGANAPEEIGDFFAWGETEPKSRYNWSTYIYCNGSGNTLTKYNWDSNYGSVLDYKSILDPQDDAANVIWGENWRTPTYAELVELIDGCNWSYTDNYNNTGVSGYIVTGKKAGYTNNSIFLPFTDSPSVQNGYKWQGYYVASNLNTNSRPIFTKILILEEDDVSNGNSERCYDQAVRPVYDKLAPVSGISLPGEAINVGVGKSASCQVSFTPSNATVKGLIVKIADSNVASATYYPRTETIILSGLAPGTTTMTVYASSGVSASCQITVAKDPEYVDLGLPSGVKWAKWNVGANAPEEYGNYYAWGETTPKDVYSWGTYLWCNGTDHTLTKYNGRSEYGSVVDHVSLLSDTDDVAKAEWKGLWRMPTYAEIRELREKCTWTWTDDYNGTGIKGYEVTGNGNSIFLPAAGRKQDNALSNDGKYGYYWAGTGATRGTPGTAHDLFFRNGYEDNTVNKRFYGFSVRPVYGEFIPVDSIELNPYDLTIVIGDSCGLSVMYGPKGYSQATSADWISDNPSVATVSSEGVVKGVGIGSANITAYSYNGLSATCQVYVSEEP